jgi:hypothetical protein
MRLNALIVPLGTLGDINLEWCGGGGGGGVSRRSKFHQVSICHGEVPSRLLDQNQSWTGRRAFEHGFNQGTCYLDRDVKFAAQVCRLLAPIPHGATSTVVEDRRIEYFELSSEYSTDRKVWYDLLVLFDDVKTLRVASRFVDALDRS